MGPIRPYMHKALLFRTGLTASTLLAVTLLLVTCSPPTSLLRQVRERGTLRVVTVNGPTTYYLGGQGQTGFDFDVAKHFADALGVRLKVIVAHNRYQVLPMLMSGKADMAAAALVVTPQRQHKVRFSPPLRKITPQLVYRLGEHRPSSLDDLDSQLVVEAGGFAAEHLKHLAGKHPKLSWRATEHADSEELLHRVAEGQLGYTIANSDLVAIDQRYYPQLNPAFNMGHSEKLALAFRRDHDDSLYNKAVRFVHKLKKNGELASLRDRYFGHLHRLDYVGSTTFMHDVRHRLPRYEKDFKKAAKTVHIDWRLLAAQAYQESHWEPDAASPTGVRGLMMLTRDTADYLDISNRLNPASSIRGGARYLRDLMNRLPASIKKPDRIWMALATYNIGLGHVMDARRITKQQGGNPNLWVDVRKRLPLLSQSKWFKKTRYGYARGYETVNYVANIRSYYDILVWMTRKKKQVDKTEAKNTPKPAPKQNNDINKALQIRSPVL